MLCGTSSFPTAQAGFLHAKMRSLLNLIIWKNYLQRAIELKPLMGYSDVYSDGPRICLGMYNGRTKVRRQNVVISVSRDVVLSVKIMP